MQNCCELEMYSCNLGLLIYVLFIVSVSFICFFLSCVFYVYDNFDANVGNFSTLRMGV